jgi:hypothetical protein
MSRFLVVCLSLMLLASLSSAADSTAAAAKTFGKAPILTEPVAIAALNSQPTEYVNHSVLITGRIVDLCRHSGCWVEVEAPDSSRIICKSLDESVHFTADCLGRQVALQGKLMYDPRSPGAVKKANKDEAAHACPAPKILISVEGATVDLPTAAPVPSPTEGTE